MITDETLKVLTNKSSLLKEQQYMNQLQWDSNGFNYKTWPEPVKNLFRETALQYKGKMSIDVEKPKNAYVIRSFFKTLYNAILQDPNKYGVVFSQEDYNKAITSLEEGLKELYPDPKKGQRKDRTPYKEKKSTKVMVGKFFYPFQVVQALAVVGPTEIQVSEKKDEELMVIMPEIKDLIDPPDTPLASIDDGNGDDGNIEDEELKINNNGDILIWPGNPFLLGSKECMQNIAAAEALLAKGLVVPNNVIIFIPRSGADGDFETTCITNYLHTKEGLNSKLKDKDFAVISNIKTLAFQKKQQTNESFSPQERMRQKLFEEEGVKQGNAGQVENIVNTKDTSQVGIEFGMNSAQRKIYCTQRIFNEITKANPASLGLNIVPTLIPGCVDDKSYTSLGKQIFNDILTFIKGNKSGSKSAEDKSTAVASMSKQQESHYFNDNKMFHLTEGTNPPGWNWDEIKTNNAVKSYLKNVFADVETMQKGFNDGGNPKTSHNIIKGVLAEIGKYYGAALTDGADMMLEGFGLGFMMPLVKRGMDELKKSKENPHTEGLEAFIESDKSTSLIQSSGDATHYIDVNTGGTK